MIRLEPPTHSLPPPATVARRLGAFAVDYLLISLYIGLLVLASLTLGPEVGTEALFALTWVLVGLYLALPLLNRRRQTPYDRAAGSVVVRTPVTDSAPGRPSS